MQHGIQWFHCLTPLHNGSGEGLGLVDRPIIRETVTDYPFVQGSSIKGAIRALAETSIGLNRSEIKAVFGAPPDATDDGARGSLIWSDAMLVLFPARSLAGTFAYVTCRLALARFRRLLGLAEGAADDLRDTIDALTARSRRDLGQGRAVGTRAPEADAPAQAVRLGDSDRVILNQFNLEIEAGDPARVSALTSFAEAMATMMFPDDAYWQKYFVERVVLVNDTDFVKLVRLATEIRPNIRIAASGISEEGLRHSEYLPAESVLVSLVSIAPPASAGERGRQRAIDVFHRIMGGPGAETSLQLGADETTGMGLVRTRCVFGKTPTPPAVTPDVFTKNSETEDMQ